MGGSWGEHGCLLAQPSGIKGVLDANTVFLRDQVHGDGTETLPR